MNTPSILAKLGFCSFAFLASQQVYADVKYRIDFDQANSEYVLYMTPDSVPSPDLSLTAQVTILTPHSETDPFQITNTVSAVNGIQWSADSRINAPLENPVSDYISFNMVLTGNPPPFGWVVDKELKVFSFKAKQGCVSNVRLITNDDPFNQLPNSMSTNPGNAFTNLGWTSANNYFGNYGNVVNCGLTTTPTDPVIPTPIAPFSLLELLEDTLQYRQALADLLAKRIADISTDLPHATDKLQKLLQKKLAYNKAQQQRMLREIEQLKAEINYLKQYSGTADKELASLNNQIATLEKNLKNVFNGLQKMAIETQLRLLRSKREALAEKIRNLNNQITPNTQLPD